MRESQKKKAQSNSQTKRPARTPKRETKSGEENGRKTVNAKETQMKASKGIKSSEVYENVDIHYVDDSNRSDDANIADSDYESLKDSSSSQGDSIAADDEKLGRDSGASRKMSKDSSEMSSHASRTKSDHERNKSGAKPSHSSTLKKSLNSNSDKVVVKDVSNDGKSSSMKVHPSLESSEGMKEKDGNLFDEASNGEKSTESDDETVVAEDNEALKQKLDIIKIKIEKLEEELRDVAALEISLYSVVPEHWSSAHKVHTPARRLSRLYIHACKHWTPSKRATIAKNAVSGLVMVSKTCGNDVARWTFWLSNTVVLREIISQAFGISCQTRSESLGNVSSLNLKDLSGSKQVNKTNQLFEAWEETSTFTSALEIIESWIFSRVVESVLWQALTPNMQSPVELINQKSIGKLLGPTLGNQQQGMFSIELWKNAFQTAFQRLCPVRASGHGCGCLPVLARMVIKQCFARLDVAMFNAILRESASQIPTDPVSDPIVDSRVLPIPAGEFSFGSGAQLKNAVGNWSRWFEDALGHEMGYVVKDHDSEADDDHPVVQNKTKCFYLLNELSEFLMLPKDLLMDKSVREEVCPSINLDVIKRVLCYFTPDEFCPDAVPGEVLEVLNAESSAEQRLPGESSETFSYTAGPVQYTPPSTRDVSEKVAEAGEKPQLDRNMSMVQKKGYTSDDELNGLDSPLTSLIEPVSPSTFENGKSSSKSVEPTVYAGNVRYALLREVWSL